MKRGGVRWHLHCFEIDVQVADVFRAAFAMTSQYPRETAAGLEEVEKLAASMRKNLAHVQGAQKNARERARARCTHTQTHTQSHTARKPPWARMWTDALIDRRDDVLC